MSKLTHPTTTASTTLRKAADRPHKPRGGRPDESTIPLTQAAAVAVLAVDVTLAEARPSWQAEADPAEWPPACDDFYFSAD